MIDLDAIHARLNVALSAPPNYHQTVRDAKALLAEVNRLRFYEDAWREDFRAVEEAERARIRAAVEGLPSSKRANNDGTWREELDRAAVLAAIDGEG